MTQTDAVRFQARFAVLSWVDALVALHAAAVKGKAALAMLALVCALIARVMADRSQAEAEGPEVHR